MSIFILWLYRDSNVHIHTRKLACRLTLFIFHTILDDDYLSHLKSHRQIRRLNPMYNASSSDKMI